MTTTAAPAPTATALTGPALYRALEGAGLPDSLTDLVVWAVQEEADLKADLLDRSADLADTAARVAARLTAGQHVNTLGELQSRGPRFDQICILYEAAIATSKRIRYSVGRAFPAAAELLA